MGPGGDMVTVGVGTTENYNSVEVKPICTLAAR